MLVDSFITDRTITCTAVDGGGELNVSIRTVVSGHENFTNRLRF